MWGGRGGEGEPIPLYEKLEETILRREAGSPLGLKLGAGVGETSARGGGGGHTQKWGGEAPGERGFHTSALGLLEDLGSSLGVRSNSEKWT